MDYLVLLKIFPHDREFPKVIERQKGLTSTPDLEKWHYARLVLLHFQVPMFERTASVLLGRVSLIF